MGTLYRYSVIVYYELTTFPCINFMCLIIMYYIHKLLLYVFNCQDSFFTVPFGGSLEY